MKAAQRTEAALHEAALRVANATVAQQAQELARVKAELAASKEAMGSIARVNKECSSAQDNEFSST